MSRRLRALAVVTGTATIGALAGGCTVFGERFEPQGDRAVAAREAATEEVEQRLDAVVGGATEHGRLREDACHEGQDNWKRTDEFAWECRVGVAAVADGGATTDDVAAALTALHDRITASGCRPASGRGLLDVVRDYWEPLRSRPGYGPADLPFEVYECSDGTRLEVVSSAPDADELARDLGTPFGGGFGGEVRISTGQLPAEALLAARASRAAQLVIIRVTKQYYAIRT